MGRESQTHSPANKYLVKKYPSPEGDYMKKNLVSKLIPGKGQGSLARKRNLIPRCLVLLAGSAIVVGACTNPGDTGGATASAGTPTGYVANFGSGTVTPIDTANNTALASIAVGRGPFAVAITPDGKYAYVTDKLDGTVSVIDTSTNTNTGTTIKVGNLPFGIAMCPNGNAYVANFGSGTVSVIDTSTNKVVSTINSGLFPLGVACSPDGKTVYIANFGGSLLGVPSPYIPMVQGSIIPIDTSTNKAGTPIKVGTGPYAVCFSPDSSTAYVPNAGSSNVSVINVATGKINETIGVGLVPIGCGMSPDGSLLLVANAFSNSVSFINTTSNNVEATVSVGTNPEGIAFTPDGKTAYVDNFDIPNLTGSNVSVINIAKQKVVSTIAAMVDPENIAMDANP